MGNMILLALVGSSSTLFRNGSPPSPQTIRRHSPWRSTAEWIADKAVEFEVRPDELSTRSLILQLAMAIIGIILMAVSFLVI